MFNQGYIDYWSHGRNALSIITGYEDQKQAS